MGYETKIEKIVEKNRTFFTLAVLISRSLSFSFMIKFKFYGYSLCFVCM